MIEVDSGGIITTYSYDGDGGRVRKVTSTPSQDTSETIYIGSLFEIETVGTQQIVRKHIFAGSNKVATVRTVNSEPCTVNFIHSDHLGSSSVITDENGDVAMRYEYSPYGEVSKQDTIHSSLDTSYLFTGKELDSNGLYYYSARYYDPVIGRFISADTIVPEPSNPQTFNRYSYCYNNPINYIDPSGHFGFCAFFAFVAKVAAAVSITAAVAGGISYAAGNEKLANSLFQVSQYAGYVAMGTGIVSAVGNAMLASGGSQLASAIPEVNLGQLVISDAVNSAMSQAAARAAAAKAMIQSFVSAGIGAVQIGLDIAGLIPGIGEVFDLANSAIYTATGDYMNAGLCAAAAVPMVGWGATGSKAANKLAKTFRGSKFRKLILKSDVRAVRYFDEVNAFAKGRFLTTKATSRMIKNPQGAKRILNLQNNLATNVGEFIIPKGSTVYVGRIAGGAKKATQVFIENPNILKNLK